MIRVFEKGAIVWLGLGQFGHGPFWASLHLLKWKLKTITRPLLFCNLPWCWVSLVLPQCLGLFRHGNLVIPQVSRSGNAYWKWEKSVPLCHLFMLDCMEWTRKEIFWKWQSLLLLISSTMWQSYWVLTVVLSQHLEMLLWLGPSLSPTHHTRKLDAVGTSSILPILDLQLSWCLHDSL